MLGREIFPMYVCDALEREYLNMCKVFLRGFASIRSEGPIQDVIIIIIIIIGGRYIRIRGVLNSQQNWSLKSFRRRATSIKR